MAIVQISRITNRKGLQENLPQLAGAELGWAIDDRRLFIGNGTLQEGAPVIGNTEILTEFSDILALRGSYIYNGAAAGYTVQTGPTIGDPISQSLQSFYDERASITDFGGIGDGVTDCTAAINRALYQLFCREVNPQIRRSLYFPAGQYLVTDSIVIPPYAKLYGEGANSSVIVLDSMSDYCVRFGDSLQQTGVNIGNNGAIAPTNIEVSSMGFRAQVVTDLVCVEDASFCTFSDVSFNGPLTTADLVDALDDTACVRFFSTLSLICNNITFRRCEFRGTTWAVNTPNQVKGVTVSDSRFDTLYQGVLLGDPAPIQGGPTGFRMISNSFDNIYNEGILVAANTSLNASVNNVFYDVANHFGGFTNPAAPVISFNANNNVSIGDMFERSSVYASTHPRIDINNTNSIGVSNADQIQIGTYVRESGIRVVLSNNVSNQTVFTVDATKTRAFRVDYTIVRDTGVSTSNVKTGTFTVVGSETGGSSGIQTDDSGVENNSIGVTLDAVEASNTVTVRYTSTNTGFAPIINYSITHLA